MEITAVNETGAPITNKDIQLQFYNKGYEWVSTNDKGIFILPDNYAG